MVTQTLLVAGTVETFDREAFRASLAAALEISTNLISVSVSAASVQVDTTIRNVVLRSLRA